MGVGEVEDMLYAEQMKKDERMRKKVGREKRKGGRLGRAFSTKKSAEEGRSSIVSWIVDKSGTRRRRRSQPIDSQEDQEFEMTPTRTSDPPLDSSSLHSHSSSQPSTSFTPSTTSNTTNTTQGFLARVPLLGPLLGNLASAHRQAAREQQRNLSLSRQQPNTSTRDGGTGAGEGWGLGSHGLREREEAERRIQAFRAERRRQMLIPEEAGERSDDDEEQDDGFEDEDESESDGDGENEHGHSYPPPRVATPLPHHSTTNEDLEDWGIRQDEARTPDPSAPLPEPLPPAGSLFWRWGPLRKWRLQDRTVYS